ncbi:PTS mannitol transporter subunit IICBA [Buchnera aphidicola (Mindarus keteleerifoliae)]|uniref:PTS mannitol transporter subunit IICBA n=1 Tax=Buchnera aphidicola TaxID=9 RepID=UPI0031B72480
MSISIKEKFRKICKFISTIITRNIGIFVALGLVNALSFLFNFEDFNKLCQMISNVMISSLLPILLAHTGGGIISGQRGAIVSSIAVIGLIFTFSIPMILGSIVISSISSFTIGYFDKLIKNKVKSGFEMLVNNFSISIIGLFFIFFSSYVVFPILINIFILLNIIVHMLVKYYLLIFIPIIIEPAKILFLNNIINHTIFLPLGIQEVLENKKSIFFFIESNPGAGCGVLIASYFFGHKKNRSFAIKSAFIEFFGGIHELYFPYVINTPKLIISLILGSISGLSVIMLFKGGILSLASPGSIVSIFIMSSKQLYLINMSAVLVSCVVSFIVSYFLLRNSVKKKDFSKSNEFFFNLKKTNLKLKRNFVNENNVRKIIFACDAGMGTSAIGASILKKKIDLLNVRNILVSNQPISLLSNDSDIIITHSNLTHLAKQKAPLAQHFSIENFLDENFYNNLTKSLIKLNKVSFLNEKDDKKSNLKEKKIFVINKQDIFLNQCAMSKEDAIRLAGKYLFDRGYVEYNYIKFMLERENLSSTYLGNFVALPHSTIEGKKNILKTGVVFLQFPKGVYFRKNDKDIVYIVIGVATQNDEHILVTSQIINALDDIEVIKKISITTDIQEIFSLFKK